ncbi:c-type cytochrome [Rheinheimera aquimaris]|uniref:c-type cytochrome n=1 Tax=Rheinheimera aquimaris TaxID=412437 RepID=UPI003A986A2A
MQYKLMLCVLLCAVFSGDGQAEMPAAAATCGACHNAAVAAATGAPQLNGQHEFYLQKQLQQWQSGTRGQHPDDSRGQQMAAIARALSADDISTLARYFSQLPVAAVTETNTDAALLDKGRRIYIGNCGACHGDKAQGNEALNAPALSMLTKDYLALQLSHFNSGVRGTAKSDRPGRQMALISRSLSAADMQAVAAYLGAGMP